MPTSPWIRLVLRTSLRPGASIDADAAIATLARVSDSETLLQAFESRVGRLDAIAGMAHQDYDDCKEMCQETSCIRLRVSLTSGSGLARLGSR